LLAASAPMIVSPSRSSPKWRGSALAAITPSTPMRSPSARRTATARLFSTTMEATSALVRIVPPRARSTFASASLTRCMPPRTRLQPTSWIAATNIHAKWPPSGSSGASPACSPADAKKSRISGLSKVSSTQLRAVCMRNR